MDAILSTFAAKLPNKEVKLLGKMDSPANLTAAYTGPLSDLHVDLKSCGNERAKESYSTKRRINFLDYYS